MLLKCHFSNWRLKKKVSFEILEVPMGLTAFLISLLLIFDPIILDLFQEQHADGIGFKYIDLAFTTVMTEVIGAKALLDFRPIGFS